MYTGKIEWEKVEVEARSFCNEYKSCIRLCKNGKSKTHNMVALSQDLTEELNWKENDRVTLYKSGSMLKLQRESVGLFYLKNMYKTKRDKITLALYSQPLCAAIKSRIPTDVIRKR